MKKEYLIETNLYNEKEKYKIEATLISNSIIYEEKSGTKVIILLEENKIIRENKNFLITLDFNYEECSIMDKETNLFTKIELKVNELLSSDKCFYTDYCIEDSQYTYKITSQ